MDHCCIDIDSMYKNNTPRLNFMYYCLSHGFLAQDEQGWYITLGLVMFDISEIEERNQFFRDFLDSLGIIWEDFTEI